MANTDQFLRKVVASIEPSTAKKDRAKRSHRFLRDSLQTGQFKARILDHYLSGSYSRDTAIEPLDDVDIVFVIDPRVWQSGLDKLFNWRPEPRVVLQSFQAAVRYRYPSSSVLSQRRSVGLSMDHLHIDLVPAIAEPSREDYVRIPDTRSNDWVLSGPRVHAARATEVNEKNNRLFKPLVKLLKFWNTNLPSTASLRSFVIETMATRIFSEHRFENLQEGLHMFFDFVVWMNDEKSHRPWRDRCGISFFWGPMKVPDLAATGSNVAANVDSDRRMRFAEKARIGRDHVSNSMIAASYANAEKLLRFALRLE
jgi:hypothetical protein